MNKQIASDLEGFPEREETAAADNKACLFLYSGKGIFYFEEFPGKGEYVYKCPCSGRHLQHGEAGARIAYPYKCN